MSFLCQNTNLKIRDSDGIFACYLQVLIKYTFVIIAGHNSMILQFFIIFFLQNDVQVSWEVIGRKKFVEIYIKLVSLY